MIAILGALLEENDIDGRLIPRQFSIPGEFTDMEITRVGVFSAVRSLSFFFLPFSLLKIIVSRFFLDNGTYIDEITFSYFT
jgi:hypothetical protein